MAVDAEGVVADNPALPRAVARRSPGHFLDLIEVEEVTGRTLRYRAGQGRVVRYDAFGIGRHAARPSIALATCWPIGRTGRGPLRYVVRAEAITHGLGG